MQYKKATQTELEKIWDHNIAENADDERYVFWKKEFIDNNLSGKAVTFLVLDQEEAVGEGTLILSSECNAVSGRTALCNDADTANINALRIQKQYEGMGHISRLLREMENYAGKLGISKLTIGVEAKETRNLAIYLHLGFTEFLLSQVEDGELVLYYGKTIRPAG